jgi:hypothetical protein
MLATDSELDEESHQVLDVHHRKNKPIKPPSVLANHSRVPSDRSLHSRVPANHYQVPANGSLRANGSQAPADQVLANRSKTPAGRSGVPANRSQVPAGRSSVPANRSQVPAGHSSVPANRSQAPAGHSSVPANRSQVPAGHSSVPANRSQAPAGQQGAPANRSHVPAGRSSVPANRSQAPAGRSGVPANRSQVPAGCTGVPVKHSQVSVDHSQVAAELSDSSEDDHEDNGTDGKKVRAARHSKTHGDAKPNHLSYYSGSWVDVLVAARNDYRRFLHITDPFPERNKDNLKDAHDILLEVIGEHVEMGGELDYGSLLFLSIFEVRSQHNRHL